MPGVKPLVLKDKYFAPIEAEVQRVFNVLIYQKLIAILYGDKHADEVLNSMTSLLAAVRAGTIWYEDGQFFGQFEAKTSKELKALGARFNPAARTFSLPIEQVPADVRIAQTNADMRLADIRKQMITALDGVDVNMVTEISKAPETYASVVKSMQADFEKAQHALTIIPVLTPAQRKLISEEWGNNLDLYIQGWAQENILKLRTEIQKTALAGQRAESLAKTLQANYGVSKNKSKFLARQETSLLMSKYQESRYKDMGITKYRWSTSHDERVRPDHRALNGKIFSFDAPPITDKRTGARNNPGEDFNCRCIAIPEDD